MLHGLEGGADQRRLNVSANSLHLDIKSALTRGNSGVGSSERNWVTGPFPGCAPFGPATRRGEQAFAQRWGPVCLAAQDLVDVFAASAQVASPGVPAPPRWIARYTVARLTENSSASSSVVCSPPRQSLTRCASCVGLSVGGSPRRRPLAFATASPFAGAGPGEVGLELGDHRQHGEQEPADRIGGVVDRAADVEPNALVSSSTMSRASGTEWASRSSFMTTRVSPSRQAARASRSLGRSRFVPVRPWST